MWQMMQKTVDLLSSRRALESDGGALGLAGGEGGRKRRVEHALSISCLDSIQVSHNIDLQEDEDHDTRQKNVKYVDESNYKWDESSS